MTPYPAYRRIPAVLLLLLLGAAVASPLQAQDRVTILNADSLVGGTVEGERVQRLLHNVHLQTGEFEIRSDSAYRFLEQDEVRAFGNIEINTPQEHIWADSLVYYTDIDFSQLRGRVIILSDSTTLFGNSVDYRFTTKVGHFLDGVRLEDPEGILTANSGFYYREADSAVFRGQVQIADSAQYIEGDSLFSNRSTEYYELYGEIYAHDFENSSTLKADYLEADSTGRRLLQGNAWLRTVSDSAEADTSAETAVDTDEGLPAGAAGDSLAGDTTAVVTQARDTLLAANADTVYGRGEAQPAFVRREEEAAGDTTHIRAAEILMTQQQAERETWNTINAHDSVRIWSPRFSAVSDTARYRDSTETFELWSDPIAWHENIQLTGPHITVRLEEDRVRELVSWPRPFAVQEDSALGRLNQITGDTLRADFSGGDISRITVTGSTHLLRFMENEQGEPDGAMELTAAVTILDFEEGALVELKQTGSPEGISLPENDQTAGRQLDRFAWNPALRPLRPALPMEPRFAPVPAARPFPLPDRYLRFLKERGGEN